MSKIFDAISKAKGDVAAFALPLIDSAGTAGAAAGPRVDIDVPPPHSFYHTRTDLKHIAVEEVNPERLERVVVHTSPTSAAADRFRILRMHLREFWTAGRLKSILVTSPLAGDGKSTTALNLATTLTEERTKQVLLIDADLHRGSLEDSLGLDQSVGLAECLQQELNPLSVIRRIEPMGWYLLSAGTPRVDSPAELLQPQEVSNLMQKLCRHFDWIVVDSPPVLALSDAAALRHHTDGSLLVARAGCTPAKAVEDALSVLGRKHVMGLVLNGIEKRDEPYSS